MHSRPSGSGKSTLACAIARKLGHPAIHLDQLQHLPDTDWQPRPAQEFAALHDAAVAGDRWIIDGNYSWLLPQRLQRATGLILLDASTTASLLRYLRRALFERERAGAREGDLDSVKWAMLHHIAITTRSNRRRYLQLLQSTQLAHAFIPSMHALNRAYRHWQLERCAGRKAQNRLYFDECRRLSQNTLR